MRKVLVRGYLEGPDFRLPYGLGRGGAAGGSAGSHASAAEGNVASLVE